jgi:hypothetical protein
MLDSDLAELYGVPTRVFNQAVKRNNADFLPISCSNSLNMISRGSWHLMTVTSP